MKGLFKETENVYLFKRHERTFVSHDDTQYANLKGLVAWMNNISLRTFKHWNDFQKYEKGNFWTKCHGSVISELIEANVFLDGFKSYEICVYTNDLLKSNQRAHGFLI